MLSLARAIDNSRYDVGSCIKVLGIPANNILLSEYRSCVQIFPQDYYILSGTIRTAIDPLNRYPDTILNEMISKFIHIAASETIDRLSLAYAVQAGGVNLSSGQKQVVAFVRASLTEAKVVILDEFNSNMDMQTSKSAFSVLRSG